MFLYYSLFPDHKQIEEGTFIIETFFGESNQLYEKSVQFILPSEIW